MSDDPGRNPQERGAAGVAPPSSGRRVGLRHRRLAIGCSVAVAVAALTFWLVRGVLLR